MGQAMETTIKESGNVKIVLFDGELDSTSSSAADEELSKLRDDGAKKVLINFEKLDFISSAGLRILLSTAQILKKVGGELRVCSLNKTIQDIFNVSGFVTLLNVFEDESQALANF